MSQVDWNALLNDCVDFSRRLIQTPSMPEQEKDIAELVVHEMTRLQFDEVWIDDFGNVSGRIHGSNRTLGALVFNSHLDHVDPGDLSLWPFPPYSATVSDGRLFGRGACDIKGPLAVQVYSMVAAIRSGLRPKRDIVVTAVVQEETGGAGALYWVNNLDYSVELVVLGEPSSNNLSLGHRGIWQTWVSFSGRSAHASVPESGTNPNFAMAHFLDQLELRQRDLKSHPLLGDTTVTPTLIEVDTQSPNVTPAWTRVFLDFRTASESVSNLRAFIDEISGELKPKLSSPWSGISEPEAEEGEIISGFYTPPDSEIVRRIRSIAERGMGWQPELTSYRFATDGRHIAVHRADIAIIGFSPGEEHLAHTVYESISIDMMLDSLKGHVELILDF
jgi:putative selenium metabolism hydrolase